MSKIVRLIMDNFQGHKHSVVDFDSNVTIITGDTDSGKTSIFRALQKVVHDTPLGVEFISTWSNSCTLTAELDNGISVERYVECRTKKDGERVLSSHHYKIIYADGREETFSGFGKTVPQEVQDVFGMNPISVGNSTLNLNFSGQHDPYFLVSSNEGLLRMKVLSRISNAELFEQVRGNIKKQERSNKNKHRVLVDEKESLEAEIKEYDKYKGLEEEFESIQTNMERVDKAKRIVEVYKRMKTIQKKVSYYCGLVMEMKTTLLDIKDNLIDLYNKNTELQKLQSCLDRIEKHNIRIKVMNTSLLRLTDYDTLSDEVDKLSRKVSNFNVLKNQLQRFRKNKEVLSKLDDVSLDIVESIEDRLSEFIEKYTLYRKYKKCYTTYTTVKKNLHTVSNDKESLQAEIDKISEKVTEFLKDNPICPTCGSDIQGKNVETLLNGLE